MRLSLSLLAMIAVCYASAQTASSSQHVVANTESANQQPAAVEEITIKSPVVVKMTSPEKTKEEATQEAAERDKKSWYDATNLTLAKSVRCATWFLAAVALLQAAIYGGQAWLLLKTLSHATDSSERALRAYLTMPLNDKDRPADPRDAFKITIVNCGQTPAYRMESQFGWNCFMGPAAPWPLNEEYVYNGENDGTKITIGADAKEFFHHRFGGPLKGKTFLEWLILAENEQATIYYFVRLSYVDIFKKNRFTKLCIRYVPNGGSPIVTEHHNEST